MNAYKASNIFTNKKVYARFITKLARKIDASPAVIYSLRARYEGDKFRYKDWVISKIEVDTERN